MMGRWQSQQNLKGDDFLITWLTLLALLSLLSFLVWRFYHTQISEVIIFIQTIEIDIISFFSDDYKIIQRKILSAKAEKVSLVNIWQLCSITGYALRWPALIIFSIIGFLCFFKAPNSLYQDKFSVDGLQRKLALIHPIGTAWIGTDPHLVGPSSEDLPLKPMDPTLKLDEWLTRFALGQDKNEQKEAIQKALNAQLGTPWNGLKKASLIEQCMFLVFSFFMKRQGQAAMDLLGDLSKAITYKGGRGTLPSSFKNHIREIIHNSDLRNESEIASRHAYTRTALLTLLYHARLKNGVVNPGLFSMVQLLDRDLWVILSAPSYPHPSEDFPVIDTSVCIEASGVIIHWLTECRRRKAIKRPQTNNLYLYLVKILDQRK